MSDRAAVTAIHELIGDSFTEEGINILQQAEHYAEIKLQESQSA